MSCTNRKKYWYFLPRCLTGPFWGPSLDIWWILRTINWIQNGRLLFFTCSIPWARCLRLFMPKHQYFCRKTFWSLISNLHIVWEFIFKFFPRHRAWVRSWTKKLILKILYNPIWQIYRTKCYCSLFEPLNRFTSLSFQEHFSFLLTKKPKLQINLIWSM